MRTTSTAMLSVVVVMAISPAWAEGDAARGERLFNQQCKACHTLEKDGAELAGPSLHALFGRKAGTGGNYKHSEAMAKSGIVWDDKTLVEYLKDPKAKVPGTKMTFIGLRQDQQQEDMIAFLRKATQ